MPPVAGGDVADEGEPVGEGADGGRLRRELEGALPGQGADREGAAGRLEAVEAGQTVEVDDDAGSGEAEVQHGDEALPAGQRAGLVAVLGEQRQRFGQRPGRSYRKAGGFIDGCLQRALGSTCVPE